MADLVLKDRAGTQITYNGVEVVSIPNAEGGTSHFLNLETGGIPSGGTAGQVLKKLSETDHDVGWGDTPIKGIDYWTEADKGEIIQAVVDVMGGALIGYVDENNVIVLVGGLEGETYTVKYKMEDESLIDIGELKFAFAVTNNLTNCTNSNSATSVVNGGAYSATISANSGYELSSITVTMGGVDITSSVVSGGTIGISSATGDIVITAVAEETIEPTNFFIVGGDGYLNPGRASTTGADRTDVTTCLLSNYIEVQNGDVVSVDGMVLTGNLTSLSGFYDANKAGVYGDKLESATSYVKDATFSDNGGQFTIDNANVGYIRICGVIPSDVNAIVVNIKRNGEWL